MKQLKCVLTNPVSYFVYILECSNGTYYTGYTTDIQRRYQEHVDGTDKCKYTRSFPPIRLAACWSVDADLSTALKIEKHIKRLTKTQKKNLVKKPNTLIKNLISPLPLQERVRACPGLDPGVRGVK